MLLRLIRFRFLRRNQLLVPRTKTWFGNFSASYRYGVRQHSYVFPSPRCMNQTSWDIDDEEVSVSRYLLVDFRGKMDTNIGISIWAACLHIAASNDLSSEISVGLPWLRSERVSTYPALPEFGWKYFYPTQRLPLIHSQGLGLRAHVSQAATMSNNWKRKIG